MLRELTLAAVVCALAYVLLALRAEPFPIPKGLGGYTLICTACASGDDVPSFPLSFAALFDDDGVFRTAAAPPPGEAPPPPQEGTYVFRRDNAKQGRCNGAAARATLKLQQVHVGTSSTLKLLFTHASGGTFEGTIVRDGHVVADQLGVFHLCRGGTAGSH